MTHFCMQLVVNLNRILGMKFLYFKDSNEIIFGGKIAIYIKSKAIYNFVIYSFLVARTIFETGTEFATTEYYQILHRVPHIRFNVPSLYLSRSTYLRQHGIKELPCIISFFLLTIESFKLKCT